MKFRAIFLATICSLLFVSCTKPKATNVPSYGPDISPQPGVSATEQPSPTEMLPKGDGNKTSDYQMDDSSYISFSELKWMINTGKQVNLPCFSDVEDSLDEYSVSDLLTRRPFGLTFFSGEIMLSGATYSLESDMSQGPKPQLVKTNGQNGYCTFKIEGGYRLYKFFSYRLNTTDYYGYPILVKESHELNDFMNIKIGDTIDDVALIDPVAGIYKQAYDQYPDSSLALRMDDDDRTKIEVFSCHLCTDCVIKFTYTRDENGQYKIIDIRKDAQFTLYSRGLTGSSSGPCSVWVYPEDYPSK